MKKLILSLTALAMTAFAFTSCEDVPQPYETPSATTDTTKVVVATGTGTADDPYNVAKAMEIIKAGKYTNEPVYVKGKIVGLDEFNSSFGNYTYYINDTESSTNQLEIYRGKGLNNQNFASEKDLKIGDEVVVYGTITLFKPNETSSGTPEMTSGNYLYSLNGQKGQPVTPPSQPSGKGTAAEPYNVAAALNLIKGSKADVNTPEMYVTGKVSSINEISTSFGNATYYISDDGSASNALYIFHSKYLKGENFTSEDQLKVGDLVVIYGPFVNYKGNTPEAVANKTYLVSINGKGSSEPTVRTGLNATFSEGQDNFTINDVSLGEGATSVWTHDDKNGYMKATAHIKGKDIACVSQLISPAFSLEGLTSATLTFLHAERFFTNASEELKVLASTDKSNWTELTVSAYSDGKDWTFVDASCDLSKFAGQKTVYIAFQYTSTDKHSATWEVKNVVVK